MPNPQPRRDLQYQSTQPTPDAALTPDDAGKWRFRTIWISDVHLGTKGCKAHILLDFLKHTRSERLYLVGDIFDGERLARSWYWLKSHNLVVQKILRRARKGAEVIYVPGNHDHFAFAYAGFDFGGIRVERDVVHETADGRRFWVTHGDQFDHVVRNVRWLSHLGDHAYELAQLANTLYNRYRRLVGKPYFPLSRTMKSRVKAVVNVLTSFREKLVERARERGLDGVICGHVHRPEIIESDGMLYCNDGDWVESCSALVEHADGRLQVLDWIAIRQMCLFEAYT
jgi:UDP-2,3-diacylglucosamine pyrophosphatase LpxH